MELAIACRANDALLGVVWKLGEDGTAWGHFAMEGTRELAHVGQVLQNVRGEKEIDLGCGSKRSLERLSTEGLSEHMHAAPRAEGQ